MATHVERSIEVEVPVRAAYDQWTRLRDFPRFMSGVQEVEQIPGEVIAWTTTSGATNAGAIRFTAVGPHRTEIRLTLGYARESAGQHVDDDPGAVERTVEVDLDRFKHFVEGRDAEPATGPRRPRVVDDPASGVLTGYPAARISHTATGGQGVDDAASGVLTGYPGDRTDSHLHAGTRGLDDPAAGVLTGYPGARVDHTETGGQSADDPAAGVLTGYPLGSTGGHVDTRAGGGLPGTDDADGGRA